MGIPLTGALSLRGSIFNEYQKVSNEGRVYTGLPASYRLQNSVLGASSVSSLMAGARIWDDNGTRVDTGTSIGPSPTNIPFGTFKAEYTVGDSATYSLRNARTRLRAGSAASNGNLKFSDYRGSFFPYFGVLTRTTAGTQDYTLGSGKFWLKASVVGGGGGGGGGDNLNGGNGGGGCQADLTFFIASSNTSQGIRLYVGGGGAGGPGNVSGGWDSVARAAGGTGYAAGGAGGRPLRNGRSGFGGGGGGTSAIVWYPTGFANTGYLILSAGGGGGGGGGGRNANGVTSVIPTSTINDIFYGVDVVAGGYSIVNRSVGQAYPSYTFNGNDAGNTGFSTHKNTTADPAIAAQPGFAGIGGDDYYSYYYKPFFQDTYGGVYATMITNTSGKYANYTVAQLNQTLGYADNGGGGGGGGSAGNPGFTSPFAIYNDIDVDFNQLGYTGLSHIINDIAGGGGMEGHTFRRNNISDTGVFEYAWRNNPLNTFPENRGPANSSVFVTNISSGMGGLGGTGASGSAGQAGNSGAAGGIMIAITNADDEGGLYTLTFL